MIMKIFKRYMVVFLSVLLLGSFMIPTFGATSSKVNQDPVVTINMKDIEERLIENNKDIKLLEYSLEKLSFDLKDYSKKLSDSRKNYTDVRDGVDQLENLSDDLNLQINILNKELQELDPLDEGYETTRKEKTAKIIGLYKEISQLDSQINSMSSSTDSLRESMNSLEAGKATIEHNQAALTKNNEITQDKLIHSANVIYLQLLSFDLDIKKLETQIELLETAYELERNMFNLKLSLQESVKTAEDNYNNALNSLDTLKYQKESLMNQLKILLDYPLSRNIKLSDVEFKEIRLPSYNSGLKVALINGKEIKYNELVLENQKQYNSTLLKNHGKTSIQVKKQEIVIAEHEINLEKVKINTENNYYSNYNNLALLGNNLKILKEQLDVSKASYMKEKLKFDLGLISKTALASSESEYLIQEMTFRQKQYEYEIGKAKYYMALEGYIVN